MPSLIRGLAAPSFEYIKILRIHPLLGALAKRYGLTPCSALEHQVKRQ